MQIPFNSQPRPGRRSIWHSRLQVHLGASRGHFKHWRYRRQVSGYIMYNVYHDAPKWINIQPGGSYARL